MSSMPMGSATLVHRCESITYFTPFTRSTVMSNVPRLCSMVVPAKHERHVSQPAQFCLAISNASALVSEYQLSIWVLTWYLSANSALVFECQLSIWVLAWYFSTNSALVFEYQLSIWVLAWYLSTKSVLVFQYQLSIWVLAWYLSTNSALVFEYQLSI
jgi:hypothetical protein